MFKLIVGAEPEKNWGWVFITIGSIVGVLTIVNAIILAPTPAHKKLVVLEDGTLWNNEELLKVKPKRESLLHSGMGDK
jgi:hypothetical protein